MSGPTVLDLTMFGARAVLDRTGLSKIQKRRLCETYGIHVGNVDANANRLFTRMLHKSLSQPVVYEGFTHEELDGFTHVRGLSLSELAKAKSETVREHTAAYQQAVADYESHQTSTTKPAPFAKYRSLRAMKKSRRSLMASQRAYKASLIDELEAADRNIRFNFLGLPAELRDAVYHLVCAASLPIMHPKNQPAIARTCHLLREEALPVYYRLNRFGVVVGEMSSVPIYGSNRWLKTILPHHLACVRSFVFTAPCYWGMLEIGFDVRGQELAMKLRDLSGKKSIRQLRQYRARQTEYESAEFYLLVGLDEKALLLSSDAQMEPARVLSKKLHATLKSDLPRHEWDISASFIERIAKLVGRRRMLKLWAAEEE